MTDTANLSRAATLACAAWRREAWLACGPGPRDRGAGGADKPAAVVAPRLLLC